MEEALLSNLKLPLLFYDFDPMAEKATIAILRTLSRFEGSERLSEETISNMLMNGELRRRMTLEPDEESQIALVRDAIIDENERAQTEVAAARKDTERLEKEILAGDEEILELNKKLAESDDRVQALSEQQSDSKQAVDQLRDELTSATTRLERTRFNLFVALPVFVGALGLGTILAWLMLRSLQIPRFFLLLISYGVSIVAGEELLYARAKRTTALASQPFWILTGRVRRFVWSSVLAVILSIIGSALWESLKDRIG